MATRAIQMAIVQVDLAILEIWRVIRVVFPLMAVPILAALLCRRFLGGD